jgi:hypothetical protein
MVNLKMLLLLNGILLWNKIIECYIRTVDSIQNFYYYIKSYFNGHHDTWLFIPGHTIPISLHNLYNSIHVEWRYDNFNNTLTLLSDDNTEFQTYKLSWLSAKILITDSLNENNTEYGIDNFIESLNIKMCANNSLLLYDIFMAWCINTKHWFKTDCTVRFQIIDDMGEDVILNLNENNNCLKIKNNLIYVEQIQEEKISGI